MYLVFSIGLDSVVLISSRTCLNLVTALVPAETTCLANSPGRTRRTTLWISRVVMVHDSEGAEGTKASVDSVANKKRQLERSRNISKKTMKYKNRVEVNQASHTSVNSSGNSELNQLRIFEATTKSTMTTQPISIPMNQEVFEKEMDFFYMSRSNLLDICTFDELYLSSIGAYQRVAIGYDEGTIMIKIGRELPVASMGSSGMIIWARKIKL
ncbi:hypothetical protein FRX31_030814 [Thalictrum thalictroides]|uniref:Uncharacterized protein n=1 Tax=Thalictrum thalictroides TaxID=46969 RepID=A0A7J6V482_THATH|nr:hypothetical protein FRX31_030814 [Thalictrum thalictroides]